MHSYRVVAEVVTSRERFQVAHTIAAVSEVAAASATVERYRHAVWCHIVKVESV